MANSTVKEKSVETRSKKAGKVLLIASIALVVLWTVLLVLRFTVFQNHDSLGNYLGKFGNNSKKMTRLNPPSSFIPISSIIW